jgi:hypothetical protein
LVYYDIQTFANGRESAPGKAFASRQGRILLACAALNLIVSEKTAL